MGFTPVVVTSAETCVTVEKAETEETTEAADTAAVTELAKATAAAVTATTTTTAATVTATAVSSSAAAATAAATATAIAAATATAAAAVAAAAAVTTITTATETTRAEATTAAATSRDAPFQEHFQVRRGFLRLLQVNCRSIINKEIEFWNLVDACDPDIVIGTESWLTEEIGSSEIFHSHYKILRRDRNSRGGGVFICVKEDINIRLDWVSREFEMMGIEIITSGSVLEIIACYKPPSDGYDILDNIIQRTGNENGHAIVIGGDLNIPSVNWEGTVSEGKVQNLVNGLVWDCFIQEVRTGTRQDAILDVYLIRPKELFISCEVVEGISDHKAVLLDLDQGRSTICSEEDRPVALFSFAAERANDVIKYRSAACGRVGRVVFLGCIFCCSE